MSSWLGRLVTKAPNKNGATCSVCRRLIPAKVFDYGQRTDTPAEYCSKKCRKRASNDRYAIRVAAKIQGSDDA